MTQEHIISCNAEIARFMSYKIQYNGMIPVIVTENGNNINPTDLLYHQSWDWLIPVAKKLFASIGELQPVGMRVFNFIEDCRNNFISGCITGNIEISYNYIVKLILWYKTN